MSQTRVSSRLEQQNQIAQPIQASTLKVTNNTSETLLLQGSALGIACSPLSWQPIGQIGPNGSTQEFPISETYRYYFLSYTSNFQIICEYVQTFVKDTTGSTTYEVTIN